MSSASSAVTYTSVYTDSELGRVFWGADEEISDNGPEEPQKPPVPQDEDKRETIFIQPHDPNYDMLLSGIQKRIQRSMRMMRPRMVRLTISWTGEWIEMMMTAIDADDEDEDEEDEDEEEEEEHLASADSAVVVPTVEHVEVKRLLANPTPPPSPPISLSSPSAGERLTRCMAPFRHSSPPPMPSPLLPSSGCPTQIQTLRIASTQALVDAVIAALPLPPLPPLPPSLYIPPPVDRRDDILESERPPRKKSCLFALSFRYKVGESSTAD
ncbi:hypothetical protein Tco_1206946, partial [Tanacetum coccineum]